MHTYARTYENTHIGYTLLNPALRRQRRVDFCEAAWSKSKFQNIEGYTEKQTKNRILPAGFRQRQKAVNHLD